MFLGLIYTRIVYFITGRASWSVESTLKDSPTDQFATELSDADRDAFKVFHLRLNRLARPEVVLPRIMRTKF